MKNYSTIVENDTAASSISSVPTSSVFSGIGGALLDEQRTLLTNETEDSSIYNSSLCIEEPIATKISASINLSNTILGTGMLAMVCFFFLSILSMFICCYHAYLYFYSLQH